MNIENLDSLNAFLENITEEKCKLERKIEELEEKQDSKNWEWLKHIFFKKDDYRKELPNPRIEINIFGDKYQQWWNIGIVYPEYSDFDNDKFIPLTQTTTTGSEILTDKNPRLPWKGEFHLYSYSRIFNMRIFLTRDSDKFIKELFVKEEFESQLSHFENKNCRI